ncbi:MAG: hypothetical protein AVO35_01230 [Candidatus Aegiribacteria sp. MLS_C]|nr:MAG: hypothetical protein AVO35_01230 [Candidatus Aegiribacteria sp. MLS_C]
MKYAMTTVLLALVFQAPLHAHELGELIPHDAGDGWKTVDIEGASLSWSESDDRFSFSLEAPAGGWVSIGFGGGPAMRDANLVIGYADDEGAHLRDDHGTSPISHSPDTDNGGSDDLIDGNVTETDGYTVMSFSLPKEPSDELDPALQAGETIRILVAWSDSDGFSGMHTEAHTAELEL